MTPQNPILYPARLAVAIVLVACAALAGSFAVAATTAHAAACADCEDNSGGGGAGGGPSPASPAFQFDPGSPLTGVTVTFDSSASTGSPTSWDWSFGDGSAHSSSQNAQHAYAHPGTYTVTLTENNAANSAQSVSHQITVGNRAPAAGFEFTPDAAVTGTQISFTNKSTDPDNLISSYHWDFGDGVTNEEVSPKHTYLTPGQKTVTLKVYDELGAMTEVQHTVTVVNIAPTADFTFPGTNVAGTLVDFDADGSTDDLGITSYEWSFGDGSTGTGVAPQHTYAKSGSYPVQLTVHDADGGSDSVQHTVVVDPVATGGGGGTGGGTGNGGSGGTNGGGTGGSKSGSNGSSSGATGGSNGGTGVKPTKKPTTKCTKPKKSKKAKGKKAKKGHKAACKVKKHKKHHKGHKHH